MTFYFNRQHFQWFWQSPRLPLRSNPGSATEFMFNYSSHLTHVMTRLSDCWQCRVIRLTTVWWSWKKLAWTVTVNLAQKELFVGWNPGVFADSELRFKHWKYWVQIHCLLMKVLISWSIFTAFVSIVKILESVL